MFFLYLLAAATFFSDVFDLSVWASPVLFHVEHF